MSTTIEQLQQLTNSQLYILCYNYYLSPQLVVQLNRRQLERRLHVAIIGERAKWRARRLLDSFQDRPVEHYGLGQVNAMPRASSNDDRSSFNEYRHLTLSKWRALAARNQASLARVRRRFSGGDEQEQLERLIELEKYREEEEEQQQRELEMQLQLMDQKNEQQQKEKEMEELRKEQEKETKRIEREKTKYGQSVTFTMHYSKQQDAGNHNMQLQLQPQQQQYQQEQQLQYQELEQKLHYQDYYRPQEQLQYQPADQQLHFAQAQQDQQHLQQQEPIYYDVWDSCDDRTTDYLSITSSDLYNSTYSLKPTMELNQHSSEKQLEPVAISNSDRDYSTECEICTIDLFNQDSNQFAVDSSDNNCQLLHLSSHLRSDTENIGDVAVATQRRPSFWRYLLQLLYADPQGKLDVYNLRYTILCCVMVACTYVGVKMLR